MEDESFRDSLTTLDEEGNRKWIFPKKPSGTLHQRRTAVTVVLLSIFFAMPFIKISGNPLMLLNIFERKFILFGAPFGPQDFHIMLLAMLTFFVIIILLTAIFGRVWCGWACPQTIFMEMVFRKIEYWIDGDYNQQRKLDQQAWDTEKILKKGAKQLIFILISLIISHTVMAYIVGVEDVINIVTKSPSAHWSGFVGILVFTAIFYGVFSYVREMACTLICPYGRLQGVLMNKDTIQVSYDYERGEPRGKIVKAESEPEVHGDCVDCGLCVKVCPTGIDIRNGSQLECISCTACVDTCDDVMIKIHKPAGLIRYASENNIAEKQPFKLTTRIIAYAALLLVLSTVFLSMLIFRGTTETTFLRVPGMLFQTQPTGEISNMYNIQIVNKSFDKIPFTLELDGVKGRIELMADNKMILEPNTQFEAVIRIDIPKSELHTMKTKLKINLVSNGKVIEKIKTNFLGPVK
ncbi:MAG: hypothetical protein RLZZ175_288 [Bacteroidota bacterium]|jgi:cytochrome c oxidase accessory protein FixG